MATVGTGADAFSHPDRPCGLRHRARMQGLRTRRFAALFGAADVSSSDGQHVPTVGRGDALGAFSARHGREATALLYPPWRRGCQRSRVGASASPRASPPWPSAGRMPSAPPAPGRRLRHSSQANLTRGPSRHDGTACCALRPRSAPAWSARRRSSGASATTRGRTGWPWPRTRPICRRAGPSEAGYGGERSVCAGAPGPPTILATLDPNSTLTKIRADALKAELL